MTFLSRFCCCFDLRTGSIFSGIYVLVLSSIFLMKHAVWLRLLLVGEVHDNLEPFLDSLLRDRNDSWNPTALNLTAELHRRNVASHTLHLLWTSGGVVTSGILLFAIFKKVPLLFLPWLSWSSVNGVILLVNSVVDVLIWSYFRLYSSMNPFTVYGYANLPFMIYLLFVTASYYQTLESIYEDHQIKCWSRFPCKRWHKVPTSSDACPASPNSPRFVQRWPRQSMVDEVGTNRNGVSPSLEQCRLMTNGQEIDPNFGQGGDEIYDISLDATGSESKKTNDSSPNRSKRENKMPANAKSGVVKKKFKPPKIKVSQPSTDEDW